MAEIPKIVSQRLRAMERTGVHPHPDLITAFVEKSLVKHERAQVLEHLSVCAGCRELVSLSAAQTDISVPASVSSGPAWLSWPVLRWGAAVACVIVVGAAVTLRHKQEASQIAPTVADEKLPAQAQIEAPSSALINKIAPSQSSDREVKTAVVFKQAQQPGQAGRNSPTPPPATIAGTPPASTGDLLATIANRQNSINANPSDGNYAAATSSSVEMADARTSSPLAEVVPGRAKAPLAESQDAAAEKVVGGTQLRKKNMAAPAGTASLAKDAFVPGDLAPRWTLSSDGTLQRSVDSGQTWQTIPVSSKTIFRALAANGLDIWVGGSAGALFHSSNAGQHWTQVRPVVSGEALVDDIIGVEFTDLLHGKLTTASGENWTTADAGQTWERP